MVAPQDGLDSRLELSVLALRGGRTRIDQAERRQPDYPSPATVRWAPIARRRGGRLGLSFQPGNDAE